MKNWANIVIQELNGAERPAFGVVFGISKTGVSSDVPKMPSSPVLIVSPADALAFAAATAAGLLAV